MAIRVRIIIVIIALVLNLLKDIFERIKENLFIIIFPVRIELVEMSERNFLIPSLTPGTQPTLRFGVLFAKGSCNPSALVHQWFPWIPKIISISGHSLLRSSLSHQVKCVGSYFWLKKR